MKINKTLLLPLFGLLLLTSCGTSIKVKPLNSKTGKLKTNQTLKDSDVIIEKKIDLKKYNQFLYVKTHGLTLARIDNYVVNTLKNIGGFDSIMTQPDLEQYIIKNNLTDKVCSISDLIGLINLQKQVGNFLICEAVPVKTTNHEFRFTFKIINPENAETVLELRNQKINFNGLDKPLFNPVFNHYIEWIKKNTE